MPVIYQIDEAKRFVLAVGHGVLTQHDMWVYLTQRESSHFRGYRQLFDLTAMTTDMSTEEMRDLVRLRRGLATPPAPIAFAIADDNLFAMFRIMQTMTETLRPIGVFRTLPEAKKWLEECSD